MPKKNFYMGLLDYYLGLDIGTDSVGYAVTDEQYNLLKFIRVPAWGVQVFEAASLSKDKRRFRTEKRRLDRRQQRIHLVRDLFANEIKKIDPRFYIRLDASQLYREDVEETDCFPLFNDLDFTDREYYSKYPTIHHLILDLMNSGEPHDVRLVYLACAWLVKNRGHFLSNIDVDNIDAVDDFSSVYNDFLAYFTDNGWEACWGNEKKDAIAEILKKKIGVSKKTGELVSVIFGGVKPSKETSEAFPFSRDAIIRLLAGGTVKPADLFGKEEYDQVGSFSLGMDDEKLAEILAEIGDDSELIRRMRALSDWAVLVNVKAGYGCISEAKVATYEQHKKDLKLLKRFVNKYIPEQYDAIFRDLDNKNNYVAYSYHTDSSKKGLKKINAETFSKYILSVFKDVKCDAKDEKKFSEMNERLQLGTFMPKQKDTNNRVIPHQLYLYELKKILENAKGYLDFLNDKEDGLTVAEKVLSVFSFRIPYFVGPLNSHSKYAWIARKAGKIYPWNFEEIVDLDESEKRFIQRMTNNCSYLPGEKVLPKDSLCYHKYMVLNEINNIRINGVRIPVEVKQGIYNDLFLKDKKVTVKKLEDYLISNNLMRKEGDILSGIDITIKSNLNPQIDFEKLMRRGILSEDDVEKIIERASFSEDKSRLRKWIEENYPQINEVDKTYICGLRIKDFGRLSRHFLCEMAGVDKSTGEVSTIMGFLWSTQNNLMELLAEDRYTFSETIKEYVNEYYGNENCSLEKLLDEMHVSNAVKRPIYRTLDIINDIVKAFGAPPKKIFIEVTRGGAEDQKGKRSTPRKQQILDFYKKCKDEDVKLLKQQLEEMGDAADSKLQGDKLFLYFMQLGKSMYSDTPIELEKLGTKLYDIDHIYPQAYVTDNSILNNRVLVLSEENGNKSDRYPLDKGIREKMGGFWEHLKNIGAITEEKYNRLVRSTPFSEEEKMGFINRQLTETSQSTKAVATLIKEQYPNTEIVYSKARLVSDFRQEFDLIKSRTFNDLHHASDAYLNIVTGNVYNMKFTKKWFDVNSKYSVKAKTIFTRPLVCGNTVVWDGEKMLAKVKANVEKNNAHFTKYAFFRKGALFDQLPVSKGEGLTPRKKNLPTEKYGGYNGAASMCLILVEYRYGKEHEVVLIPVEVMHGDKFLSDDSFAKDYVIRRIHSIWGKDVTDISFPLGMRPLKINSILSLDGFRVCLTGISDRGQKLRALPIMQFMADRYWQYYLKKIEAFCEKSKKNNNYIYQREYDKVSKEDNEALYDIYCEKLRKSIYSKRINSPLEILEKGKDAFRKLDVKDQCFTIMNIHQIFGRNAGGCDLSAIGGKANSGASKLSAKLSNWSKKYTDVRIIDSSSAGLWEKESCNLLELL